MQSKNQQCGICPHACKIDVGSSGKCNVIKNVDGVIKNVYEGICSNIAVEPIEKRPFFHFLPGSKFLSVGFYGCQFSCLYCLNFTVSQQLKDTGKVYSPLELIGLALEKNVSGIAFTYNEPTIFHEYIEEVGYQIEKRSLPLKIVLKTNGFVSHKVMRNLCLCTHAINVDIKGDDKDYEKICGGWLDPVLDRIKLVYDMGCHLEINYLVVPSKIKDKKFNIRIRNFIASISKYIPVHLLYFHPFHKMVEAAYDPIDLLPVFHIFSRRLKHVYISNSFSPDLISYRNSSCLRCGDLMINRVGSSSIIKTRCCKRDICGTY